MKSAPLTVKRDVVVGKLASIVRGEREAKQRGDTNAYNTLTALIGGYCSALEDALGIKEADAIYRDAKAASLV